MLRGLFKTPPLKVPPMGLPRRRHRREEERRVMAAAAVGRGRARRVADLLDDKVKARLRGDEYRLGYVSSGSEHEGAGELAGFVDGIFFSDEEEDDGDGGGLEEGEDDEESEGEAARGIPPSASTTAMVRDLLKPAATGDPFRRELAAEVAEAAERLAALRPNRAAFRRAVMGSLRESGYNAGICKARWESRGGATAGNYEYIDVLRASSSPSPPQRYLVDVEFAGEFEIARPSPEYERLAAQLPRVYVGRPEELKRLLRLLADAAKRSLQSREMHVPPWRKGQYMQAKWLGAYRRTVNPAPRCPTAAPAAPAASHPSFTAGRDVKCRLLGFYAAAPLGIPPAARTR